MTVLEHYTEGWDHYIKVDAAETDMIGNQYSFGQYDYCVIGVRPGFVLFDRPLELLIDVGEVGNFLGRFQPNIQFHT